MAYAEGRIFHDADSHIMELPGFLRDFADPGMRDRLPRLSLESAGRNAEGLRKVVERGAHTDARVEEMIALGDQLISGPKGYMALGAFNREERKRALDQLGFDRQLVFSTFATAACFHGEQGLDVRYAAARAHNRAMTHFCADDPRLMGVGALPLEDPRLAALELDHLIESGLAAAWVPHRPCGGRSPGHDDLDPIWARLSEAGVPFVLHVGGDPLQIHPDWMNTGRPVPTDWLGGGENIRSKDMTSLHHKAETFLGAMVLDGVLERFPKLRGGAIELGAGWVPSMLKRLDWSAEIWRKSEPELQKLDRLPSEQITEQLGFTPFVYENVGELIEQSNDSLYMFSSDYPHFEGGRNPLGRFGAALEGHDEPTLDRFYASNFTRVFGLRESSS